jgi:cbb3-type cytochrome oxidase subunit 3
MFRKELRDGKDLNNQIAGNKGLQEVFEMKRMPDSIAKYANLGYILNDSAYSLSEMQNIQKLQASYNYEHAKLLAEQKSHESDRAYLTIVIIVSLVIVAIAVAFYAFSNYRRKKEDELKQYRLNLYNLEKAQTELQELMAIETQNATSLIEKKNQEILNLQESIVRYRKLDEKHVATLESRLDDADIIKHLHSLVDRNPPQIATLEDFRQLKMLVNEEIPSFYSTLNTPECSLRTIEYEVCLLTRCHFLPSEICKLTGRNESYISNLRKAILLKLYGVKGAPKDLDQRIMAIK